MDKTEALLGHFRSMAAWLEIAARDYENGTTRHFTDTMDDSVEFAAGLRHKAGNILAVIDGYNRLKSRGG
jgi:hypothetical protein